MSIDSILADAGGGTQIAVRTLALGATATIIGASAFRRIVIQGANRDRIVTGLIDPTIATTGMAAATTLAIAAPWRILGQADAFMSPGDSIVPVVGLVLQTTWGHAAAVQVVAAFVALLGFYMARRAAVWGWTLALSAALVLAVAPAWMGHAAATESRPFVAIAADALHVAAGGIWAGGVIVLAIALRMLSRQATGGALGAELIARFRVVALTGAGVIVATGVVSALFRLNSPVDLIRSPYGVMLTIKLALVGVAALLGRRHSVTSAVHARRAGAGAVAASIAAEALLFLAVVAVSALLSASPPPGE